MTIEDFEGLAAHDVDWEASWLVIASQDGYTAPYAIFLDEEAALCFCLDSTSPEVEFEALRWNGSGWSRQLP